MLKEAIQEIVQLGRQNESLPLTLEFEQSYDGERVIYEARVEPTAHGRKIGDILKPFRPAPLEVGTLTGFVDAINAGVAGTLNTRIVHIEDFRTVGVKTTACDVYGIRDTLLIARHEPINAFRFDWWYDNPAKFIIALQSAFLVTDNLLYVIRIASNLKAGKSITVQDDGFSQVVALKAGEVTTAEVKVQPRIKLVPLRTFAEAAPVESEFLIRFQQSREETPEIALFSVDGTKWQGETMRSIKDYLVKTLPAAIVLA